MSNLFGKELKSKKKEKIKKYKRQLKSEIFDLENELDINKDEEAQIHCNLHSINHIFSPFDIAKDRTITDEFHSFLLEETDIIPMQYELELVFHVNKDFSTTDENKIKKAIKRFYSFKITSDIVRTRKTNFKCFFLFLCGIICLSLCPIVSTLTTIVPLYESLLILTWFFIWEGSSAKFFDGSKLATHKFNMLRLYNAKITFIKED